MLQPNGVRATVTSVKWRKEYRHYRRSRCRLYVCMILFMVFIALAVVCGTFLFRNSFYYHPQYYELNSGEKRVVQVSTLFCEGIVVKEASFQRQIIVVSSPLARRAASDKFMSTDIVLLRRDRTWYRSFYLLKASTVSVRVVSRHSINVYWLKGRRILDKWTDQMRKDLKDSSKQNTEIFTGTSMSETFTVNEDNNYYLGITSIAGNTNYSEIFVNMSISRIMYDISSCVTSCHASVGESCEVKLRFNSLDTAVIAVADNGTALPTRDVWTTWYCKPRIWFYAAVFAGTFVLVIVLLSCIYCCIMSRVKKKIRKWRPYIPVRTESLNNGAVTLQSINVRGSTLDENSENVLELTPLRLTPARDSCQDNNKPDVHSTVCTSTPNAFSSIDGANNNIPNSSDANCANFTSEPAESALWRRTPSPRWSTFLQDAADDYEECVTDFRESPINTLHSIQKATEDESFENALRDRLQNLQTDEEMEYEGPIETDIDDYNADAATYPFLTEATCPDDAVHHMNESSNESDVVLRQKNKNKEQRWEPRLSVVTEI